MFARRRGWEVFEAGAMNLDELARWLTAAIGRRDPAGARLFGRLAETLDLSVDRRHAAYDAFEISVNSAAPGLVQLTHVHLYPPGLAPSLAVALQARKTAGALAAIESLGSSWSGRPLGLARLLLNEFRAQNITNGSTLFSCEYDLRRKRIVKATLYASLRRLSQLAPIKRILGIVKSSDDVSRATGGYDCFGVDLYPDGRPSLKIYEVADGLSAIRDRRVRSLCAGVAREYDIHQVLLLRRMNRNGKYPSPAKFVLRLRNGIPAQKLASLPGLRAYRRYLGLTRSLLGGQTIYYLRFDKTLSLGLDFRKTPAPWTRKYL